MNRPLDSNDRNLRHRVLEGGYYTCIGMSNGSERQQKDVDFSLAVCIGIRINTKIVEK